MIACIGGAHLDRHGVLRGPLVLGTSNPGAVHVAVGGVARNVAENLARLGEKGTLVSRVGNDVAGRQVREHADAAGIDTALFTISRRHPTASYTAILENNGELVVGLADMEIYEEVTPAVLEPFLGRLREHSHWFVDANIPGATIDWLLSVAGGIPVAVDAISVAKAPRLAPLLPRISLLFANLVQADAICGADPPVRGRPPGRPVGRMPNSDSKGDGGSRGTRADQGVRPTTTYPRDQAAQNLRRLGARAGIVTAGAAGIAIWSGDSVHSLSALPAQPRDVTGAGDALVAGTLFGILQGHALLEAARLGLAAAAITVESPHAAAPELTAGLLRERLSRESHAGS
jgi:pseudouridine kinase